MTLRVVRGLPSLRDARLVRELERSFGAACERGDFRLVHYSIQRDHLHLLVEADGPVSLARGMIAPGARLARAGAGVARSPWREPAPRLPSRAGAASPANPPVPGPALLSLTAGA